MAQSDTNIPLTEECHCMHVANKYHVRKFVNQLNQQVIRVFYRCTNCASRIHRDFIPDMDKAKTVNVFELMKNKDSCRKIK